MIFDLFEKRERERIIGKTVLLYRVAHRVGQAQRDDILDFHQISVCSCRLSRCTRDEPERARRILAELRVSTVTNESIDNSLRYFFDG